MNLREILQQIRECLEDPARRACAGRLLEKIITATGRVHCGSHWE